MKVRAELKLIGLAIYSVMVIIASHPYHYAVLAGAAILFIILARPARIARTLAYALPVIVLIVAVQALLAGTTEAAISFVRMALLYIAGAAVTVTSSQAELMSAIENILRPLSLIAGKDIGRDLATMTALAIAFLPAVREEYLSIKTAMKSRGVSFQGPVNSVKGTTLIVVPLFRSLSNRADRIAMAMHARCYGISLKK